MSFLLIIAMATVASDYAAIPTNPPPPAKLDKSVGPVATNDFAPPPPGPNRAPIPRGLVTQWVTPNHYPTRALVEKREGTTGFMLSVTKWGTVSQCQITRSSGHEDLDQSTCNSAAYKARFWPATDARGNPTEGRYSNNVRWQIPVKNSGNVTNALEQQRSPNGNLFQHTGTVFAEINIDANGKLGACKIASSSESGFFQEFKRMEADICNSNSIAYRKLSPIKDPDGNPVARKVIVKFSMEHGEFEAADAARPETINKSRNASPHNSVETWITPKDYPEPASRMKAEGKVGYTLFVTSDGRAQACKIDASSGNSSLDEATCIYAVRRARFKPALDENGNPTMGSWTGSYGWKIPE